MAEGTSLLRMHTAYTCIVGSNPTVSARLKQKSLPCGRLFYLSGRNGGIRRRSALKGAQALRIAHLPRPARSRWPRSGQRRPLISGSSGQFSRRRHARRAARGQHPCRPGVVVDASGTRAVFVRQRGIHPGRTAVPRRVRLSVRPLRPTFLPSG